MNDLTVRSSRGLGWLLYLGGLVALIGYGSYAFAMDDTVPAIVKTAVAGTLIGAMLLFVSVLRQRIIVSKSDKYKDVQI